MGLKIGKLIIQNGQSASEPLTLAGDTLVGVYIDPAGFTGNAIGFRASWNGSDFHDVFSGGALLSEGAAASRFIPLDPDKFRGVEVLRVVSLTAPSTPVAQLALRTLTPVFREVD